MGFHSRLSPSGAPKYLNCTKAPSMEDGLPDVTSVYAARGTLGHWVAEQCLLDGGDPTRFAEKWYYVDDEADPVETGSYSDLPLVDGTRVAADWVGTSVADPVNMNGGYIFFLKTSYCEKMMKDLAETRELADGGEIYIESRVPLDYPLGCLLYTSPSPRDQRGSRMPSSA